MGCDHHSRARREGTTSCSGRRRTWARSSSKTDSSSAEKFGDVFGSPNQFLKVYKLCMPNHYDFMHCDLQSNPPLAYHNFEHVVAEGDHINKGSRTVPDEDPLKKDEPVFSAPKV